MNRIIKVAKRYSTFLLVFALSVILMHFFVLFLIDLHNTGSSSSTNEGDNRESLVRSLEVLTAQAEPLYKKLREFEKTDTSAKAVSRDLHRAKESAEKLIREKSAEIKDLKYALDQLENKTNVARQKIEELNKSQNEIEEEYDKLIRSNNFTYIGTMHSAVSFGDYDEKLVDKDTESPLEENEISDNSNESVDGTIPSLTITVSAGEEYRIVAYYRMLCLLVDEDAIRAVVNIQTGELMKIDNTVLTKYSNRGRYFPVEFTERLILKVKSNKYNTARGINFTSNLRCVFIMPMEVENKIIALQKDVCARLKLQPQQVALMRGIYNIPDYSIIIKEVRTKDGKTIEM
ncbi:hypothetical protein ACFL6I_14385 [candidate division KSB1 bacterium]